MSKEKFTEGDWVRSGLLVIESANGDYVASCNTVSKSVKECTANADLIAAAPDLLEVIEQLLELAENLEVDKFGKIYSVFKFSQARKAISKAKGKNYE